MTPLERSRLVKQWALDAGFDACGVAAAEPIGRTDYLRAWLASERAGSMHYLRKHVSIREDPRTLLSGSRSIIVTALSYHQPSPESSNLSTEGQDDVPHGRVAMYAWGEDYHVVLRRKLETLIERLRAALSEPFEARVCVDTAPLLEREVAARAGVGWIGKNTLVLNAALGSYFFLGSIVTTLELAADEPSEDHCGTCRACLDACPTNAFPAAYEMDASRCISYLTIEHRGDIDPSLQPLMGDWLFGCDVCQEVCPHNRKATTTTEPAFTVRSPAPSISTDEIRTWTEDDYRAHLRGSAMKRAKLSMLNRNADIVARNESASTQRDRESNS